MHYKNGRPAKDGDMVVNLSQGICGLLHSTQPQSTSCNGRIAIATPNDAWVTVGECLHIDDVRSATVPISTKD